MCCFFDLNGSGTLPSPCLLPHQDEKAVLSGSKYLQDLKALIHTILPHFEPSACNLSQRVTTSENN